VGPNVWFFTHKKFRVDGEKIIGLSFK